MSPELRRVLEDQDEMHTLQALGRVLDTIPLSEWPTVHNMVKDHVRQGDYSKALEQAYSEEVLLRFAERRGSGQDH